MSAMVVAIDGPSGSGKSTVARGLAREFSLAYLDTGSMYRALAVAAIRQGLDLDDQEAVASLLSRLELTMELDPFDPRVYLAGDDVTALLHTSDVSRVVSKVATNLDVRAQMKERQRALIRRAAATGAGIVAEGRDITTVVAPDATVRILLTASEEARLARRALQRYGTDDADAIAQTHDEVVSRDRQDSTVVQFMEASDGVVQIDSSNLTLDQTLTAAGDLLVQAGATRVERR
ncbi:MAG: (d)CMP kinase [Bowdeniella nasicola]|nr:(d)CMP kinase [Bowdeniella nasicola]